MLKGLGFTKMKIGALASKTDLSIDTLRFYEREGLIASPRRLFSGYRDYPEEVLGRLDFIKEAKGLGFSLREIKELLSMGVKSTRECGPVTHKAQQKLADDPSARDELLAMGFRAVPVIKVGNETMIGFSAPKLRKMLSL